MINFQRCFLKVKNLVIYFAARIETSPTQLLFLPLIFLNKLYHIIKKKSIIQAIRGCNLKIVSELYFCLNCSKELSTSDSAQHNKWLLSCEVRVSTKSYGKVMESWRNFLAWHIFLYFGFLVLYCCFICGFHLQSNLTLTADTDCTWTAWAVAFLQGVFLDLSSRLYCWGC